MIVNANILNMPKSPIMEEGYLVVRHVEGFDELWYYGFYTDETRAKTAAGEIGNGITFKVSPTMKEPGAKEVYFTSDDEKVYKNTPIGNSPDNFITKTEIVITKDVLLDVLRKWGR